MSYTLLSLEPVPMLLSRTRQELSAEFDFSRPIRISRAPGRLDVMGGIADYTGSLVCEYPLDCAAAVALQERADRQIQVFSFNLLDENQPFTLRMPLDRMAGCTIEQLHKEFAEPGRKWAGYLVGCLFMLHERKLIDLKEPSLGGINIALYSTVPLGAGVSSSAAIEVATMMNLVDHLGLRERIEPLMLASMCQAVENHIVGAPCGIMDQVTSIFGQAGSLLRLVCQPHSLQPPLMMPRGFRAVGINSAVKHSVGGGIYGRTRCAAFMGHAIILAQMREMARASGRELSDDPLNGYLANLDEDHYRRVFRPLLPQRMHGSDFLAGYGGTIDKATRVDPTVEYHVQQATDHHVFEARRVRLFCEHLEQAALADPGDSSRSSLIAKAGQLMYGSHASYTDNALLGAEECDLLVELVRQREPAGLYGAKITGGGSGGTVALLCDTGQAADQAIAEIMEQYRSRTGHEPKVFPGTSPGAWHAGTRREEMRQERQGSQDAPRKA